MDYESLLRWITAIFSSNGKVRGEDTSCATKLPTYTVSQLPIFIRIQASLLSDLSSMIPNGGLGRDFFFLIMLESCARLARR